MGRHGLSSPDKAELPPSKRPRPNGNQPTVVTNFKCHPCNRYFTTSKALLRHQRENKRHIEDAGSSREFQCRQPGCTRSFVRQYDRERHEKEQHGDGKKACTSCGKIIRPRSDHKDAQGRTCGSTNAPERTDVEATAVIQDDIQDMCDGFCFLRLARDKPPLIPDRVLSLRLAHDKRGLPERAAKAEAKGSSKSRTIPCGLCRAPIHADNSQKLFAHLASHMEAIDVGHWCKVCQINFSSTDDLQRHLSSAASKGECGFSFQHRYPCTGHHSPYEQSDDGDRFNFCYRLRQWELLQLQGHKHSLGVLLYMRSYFREICTFAATSMSNGVMTRLERIRVTATFSHGPTLQGSLPNFPLTTDNTASVPSEKAISQDVKGLEEQELALDELLRYYVCAGAIEQARSLLDLGVDSGSVDNEGYGLLHYAVISGSLEMTKELLRVGLPVDITASDGANPLDIAIQLNLPAFITLLIEHGTPFDATARMQDACRKGTSENVGIFFRHGAQIDALTEDGSTCLHLAASTNNVELVTLLLEHGAEIGLRNHDEKSAFEIALETPGSQTIAGILLSLGASIQARPGMIIKAIANRGDPDLVESLIQAGVDPNERDQDGYPALYYALHDTLPWRRSAMIHFLVNGGADINVRLPGDKSLLRVCRLCDSDKIEILLDLGAKIMQRPVEEPFDISRDLGQCSSLGTEGWDRVTRIAHRLLDAGATIRTRNSPRGPMLPSYLRLAFTHKLSQDTVNAFVKLLLRAGADVNEPDLDTRETPLHIAASAMDHSRVAELLLASGADVCIPDNHGKRAFDMALKSGLERANFATARSILEYESDAASINRSLFALVNEEQTFSGAARLQLVRILVKLGTEPPWWDPNAMMPEVSTLYDLQWRDERRRSTFVVEAFPDPRIPALNNTEEEQTKNDPTRSPSTDENSLVPMYGWSTKYKCHEVADYPSGSTFALYVVITRVGRPSDLFSGGTLQAARELRDMLVRAGAKSYLASACTNSAWQVSVIWKNARGALDSDNRDRFEHSVRHVVSAKEKDVQQLARDLFNSREVTLGQD